MAKVNVILDANIVFYRIAFRMANSRNNNKISSEREKLEFLREVNEEFRIILEPLLPFSKRIIFTRDFRTNWREAMLPFSFGYKAGRNKDFKFDLAGMIECFNTYFNHLEECGVYNFNVDYMEGDDLLYYLSETFYRNNESSILVSKDSDIPQTIKEKDGIFIVVFNDEKKFFIKNFAFKNEEDSMAAFLSGKETIEEMITKKSIELNPKKVLLVKILSGDDSDNIPSCILYLKKAAKKAKITEEPKLIKKVNFTELRVEQLLLEKPELVELIKNGFDENGKVIIAKAILDFLSNNKLVSETEPPTVEEIIEGINRNILYIHLNMDYYPDLVKEAIGNKVVPILMDKDFYKAHAIGKYSFLEKYKKDTANRVVSYKEF